MQKYFSTLITIAALALAVSAFSGCASTRAASKCGPAPVPCPTCPEQKPCEQTPCPACPTCGDKKK